MKLWELTAELSDLQRACDTVERPEELQPFLDCLADCKEETIQKIDGIAALINDLEHRAEAATCEQKRLLGVALHYQKKAAWLREYVQRCLQGAGIEKVSGTRFVVALHRCPASVKVLDESIVPAQFQRRRTENFLDKAGILEFWKTNEGAHVPGVQIVNDKKRLSIK